MVNVSRSAWPEVAYEDRPWVPRTDVPRRRQAAYAGPYRAAVVPVITGQRVELASGVMALADEATVEIARFDAEMGAEIAPFASMLLRSESAASSRIENLTASATAVALAELGDRGRRNAAEIVANTCAMRAAIDLADRIDADAILAMHAALLGEAAPEMVGRWRAQQVWIGGHGHGPHTAAFVPPHHDRVPAAMDDLVSFMRRDDIPTLAHVSLAHAQFETIHPFPDGNGRTGRALVHSLLRTRGLTTNVTVPVSAGLLVDVDAYFEALGAYRRGDPEPIVERMADAAFAAIANGRALVAELRAIRSSWVERIDARRQAVVWRAVDLVLRQPVVDADLVQRSLGVSTPGAGDAIARLVEIGALRQLGEGRRNRRYAATEVLDALDAFADRGGRRGAG